MLLVSGAELTITRLFTHKNKSHNSEPWTHYFSAKSAQPNRPDIKISEGSRTVHGSSAEPGRGVSFYGFGSVGVIVLIV